MKNNSMANQSLAIEWASAIKKEKNESRK